ncbi:MAG: hypothetical protein A2Z09_05380 [Nitrospirae bacterium RBG_16_43_8]|nr:MAG: hypothetical protein A2Z09_05380 [Nitrospirae bacterium RBG_16_43_8]
MNSNFFYEINQSIGSRKQASGILRRNLNYLRLVKKRHCRVHCFRRRTEYSQTGDKAKVFISFSSPYLIDNIRGDVI